MCLITCGWEVCSQEIHQSVHLPLIGSKWEVHRQEVCKDIDLSLIEPGAKYSGLVDLSVQGCAKCHSLSFSGNSRMILASI